MNRVIENQKLIHYILDKYFRFRIRNDSKNVYQDYFQEGMIGLVKADKFYDNTKAKFSTYACISIYRQICSFIKRENRSNKEYTNSEVKNNDMTYDVNYDFEILCDEICKTLNDEEKRYIERIKNGEKRVDILKPMTVKQRRKFLKKIQEKINEKNIIV